MLQPVLVFADAAANALMGVGALIVVTIVGGVVALRIRRAMLSDQASDKQGLLLSDLRAMRARGEISEEEFERLRDATLRGFGFGPDAGKATSADEGEGDSKAN